MYSTSLFLPEVNFWTVLQLEKRSIFSTRHNILRDTETVHISADQSLMSKNNAIVLMRSGEARAKRLCTHVPNQTWLSSTLERLWSDGWFRRRTCVELNSGSRYVVTFSTGKYTFWIHELCPNRKAVTNISLLSAVIAIFREANSNSRFSVLSRQVFFLLNRLFKGKSNKLGYYHEEKAKNEFALKKLAYTVPFIINRRHTGILLSLFLATT